MYLADALSRAYPQYLAVQSPSQSEFCHSIEALDATQNLQISTKTLQRIRDVTLVDNTLQVLMRAILHGWPHNNHWCHRKHNHISTVMMSLPCKMA